MLSLTPANIAELDTESGWRITCASCTATLFVPCTFPNRALARAGWQQAQTEHEHLPAVCPNCVAELKENERELNDSATDASGRQP